MFALGKPMADRRAYEGYDDNTHCESHMCHAPGDVLALVLSENSRNSHIKQLDKINETAKGAIFRDQQ